jgi:hypothetical protein
MAVIIFGAQAISRHAHHKRLRAETQRLRSVLTLGLSALQRTYEDDMELLPHRPRRLVSGRHQMNLLRSQMGRMTNLETPETEAVMRACIAAERVETFLEIAGKQMGKVAVPIPQRNELKASLKTTMVEAIAQIRLAVDVLDPQGDVRRRAQAPDAPQSPAPMANEPRNFPVVSRDAAASPDSSRADARVGMP